jgi:hypothetical protein
MPIDFLASLSALTDAQLLDSVRGLAGRSRAVTAQIVAHLAEMLRRGVALGEGYGSLHVYCVEALPMSDAEAYLRIGAAYLARRFPVVLEMLADGSTNVSNLKVLSAHLTQENHLAVLEEARGKRKHQVEQIVARLAPRPDVPTSLRKVPKPALTAVPELPSAPPAPAPATVAATGTPAPRPTVVALSPARYSYHVTIDEDVRELLQLARDLSSHAVPHGDDSAILKRALEAYVMQQARARFATTGKPREGTETSPESRHIPARVKRAVYVRDRGRCSFVSADGRRCDARHHLQFDHRQPWASGGDATPDNIRLLCRAHNLHRERGRARSGASPGLPQAERAWP